MKKILALVLSLVLVAGVCTTAMATALTTNPGNTNTGSQSIGLGLTVEQGAATTAYTIDEASQYIWNIDFSAISLTWDVIQTSTTTYTSRTWNASTHQYDIATTGSTSGLTTSLKSNETAAKTITIANHCNFPLSYVIVLTEDDDFTTWGGNVTLNSSSTGSIAVGGSASGISVTIDVSEIITALEDTVTVGSLDFTFTAGDIQTP